MSNSRIEPKPTGTVETSQDYKDLKLPNPLDSGTCVLPKPSHSPVSDALSQHVTHRLSPDFEYKAYAVYDLNNPKMEIVLLCDTTTVPDHPSNESSPSPTNKNQDASESPSREWLGEFVRSEDPEVCGLEAEDSGIPSELTRLPQLGHLTGDAGHPPVPRDNQPPEFSDAVLPQSAHAETADVLDGTLNANGKDVSLPDAVVDRDGDGFHSRSELQAALSSNLVSGEHAISVAIMLKHYEELQGLSNDELLFENSGVTEKDAAALQSPENQALLRQMRADFQSMTSQLLHQPTSLFGVAGEPSIHAFRQNQTGDCYLLAVAGSLAELRPEVFREMFQQNPDGTVRVKFRGGYRGQFDVEAPQDGELLSYAEVSNDFGFWPQVLEKAAGQYRMSSYLLGVDPHAAVDNGGRPESVIQLLTGHQTNTDWLMFHSADSIEKLLATAVAEQRATVLAINPTSASSLEGTGLSDSHAYSVVGYDRETGLFTIVDPNKVMEFEPTRGDGFIQISAEQIKAYFSESIVETHSDIFWSVFSL